MAKVELKNVFKKYDSDYIAVNNFNLVIEDKEFVVFVGPSGCGKSTTLRMIAGLEDITDGEIYIGDKLVNDVEPKDRNIAMVFQNYALYPHMTVYENMAFSLKLAKKDKKEIDERINNAANMLNLQEYMKRKPKALSGGQRQRVALGRAIVRDPSVFLMDEPLSNLDAKLRVQTRMELSNLHKELQATFIYVTHDQTEAMTMGDRVVVMDNGIIQQVDTPSNIYNHPVNIFVAGFIGSPQMNFLSGTLNINELGAYEIHYEDKIIKLGNTISDNLKSKDIKECNITLGFRPEDVLVVNSGIYKDYDIDVKLGSVELVGADNYLHLNTSDNTNIIVRTRSDYNVHEISEIGLSIDKEKIHIFDRETGISL